MTDRKLTSPDAVNDAYEYLIGLLHSANPESAVDFVDSLQCDPPYEQRSAEMRAVAYTDAGAAIGRRDWIESGATLWRELGPENSPNTAYNLANAESSLWEITLRERDFVAAWENEWPRLHEARALYERVVRDAGAPDSLRVQALTNAGNSLDVVGRDLDAIALYGEALAIDPAFAMALGNRGLALTYFAPYMGVHASEVQARAAADLRASLQNLDPPHGRVSPQRQKVFRAALDSLQANLPTPSEASDHWHDPHLRWCAHHGLFLHVWPQALTENSTYTDPLMVRGLKSPMGWEGLERLHNLVDAFNSLKQDYVATRYSLWLAADPDSPIGRHGGEMSSRTLFVDTLQCARWGIRTGMMIQGFAAGTNLLDKIAGFVHLYLGTGRLKNVSFSRIDRAKIDRPIDAQLRTAVERPESNIGLMALLDLSRDLRRDTALKDRGARRDKATHRFVVAHNFVVPESHEWVDRVEWLDLTTEAISQLQTARAALIYLARFIDRHESVRNSRDTRGGVDVPMGAVDTRLSELL